MRRFPRPVEVFAAAQVAAAASALAQEGASTARPPEDLAFFYLRAGASIRLTPSDLCAATLARDEQERGVAATPKELEPAPARRYNPELVYSAGPAAFSATTL